ncbi:uncharacterized protein LOC123302269 [Chrysoperla carnea]|uniref:uncharacterized protein LOC123302269 n=1 Tax=Chrysoperla carnea TaxID=189513 RepID=UPI001D07DA42|nr:uncharacterized protein LOC123302269 [Chrysoperla carnea]
MVHCPPPVFLRRQQRAEGHHAPASSDKNAYRCTKTVASLVGVLPRRQIGNTLKKVTKTQQKTTKKLQKHEHIRTQEETKRPRSGSKRPRPSTPEEIVLQNKFAALLSDDDENDDQFPKLPQEIKEELEELNVPSTNVFKMNIKNQNRHLYKVDFPSTTSYQQIPRINTHLSTKIYWAKYQRGSGPTQCFHCEAFGHSASNSFLKPKCVKCLGEHETKESTKDAQTTPKCINCQGDHPANFRKCPTYIGYLKKLEERRMKNATPRFIPAFNLTYGLNDPPNEKKIKTIQLQKHPILGGDATDPLFK